MDRGYAAQLLAELSPPHPAELFARMGGERASAILADMSTDKAVWRLSELEVSAPPFVQNGQIGRRDIARSDRDAGEHQSAAEMTTSDGAEVLAKMDSNWARNRLAELDPRRALELLVAIRPPRRLLKDLDDELAGRLLSVAVAALARHADDEELIDTAQTYADRIKADAEAQVQQMLTQAPVRETEPGKPTLGARILESLRRNNRQTVTKLAHTMREPETKIRAELSRLVSDGRVFEHSTARSAVSHYSLRV